MVTIYKREEFVNNILQKFPYFSKLQELFRQKYALMDYWNCHLTEILKEVYGDLYRVSPEQEMPIEYTTSPIQCICKFHGPFTMTIDSIKKCYNSCIQCNAHNYHDIYLDANSHRIIFSPQELLTIEVGRRALNRARGHAKEKNVSFTLTMEWIVFQLKKLSFSCEYSGISFDINKPWLQPSIDQYEAGKGYDPENCRLILLFLQYGKNSWSFEHFRHVIECMATQKALQHVELLERASNSRREVPNVVDLNKPIEMNVLTITCFKHLEHNTFVDHRDLKKRANFNNQQIKHGLKKLLHNGYITKQGNRKFPIYKLNNVQEVNLRRKFFCTVCKSRIPTQLLKRRKDRSSKLANGFESNRCIKMCIQCRNKSTQKSISKNPKQFLWQQVSMTNRAHKHGNAKKEDMPIPNTCAISGMPIAYEPGRSDKASVDRIDSRRPYDKDNIQTICLFLQWAKNDFDSHGLLNEEIMNIIRTTHTFLSAKVL